MKHMDKSIIWYCEWEIESADYKKLRELKKNMESLQEECDVENWFLVHS